METPVKGAPGLAEIFFGPFANLLRRRRASRVPGRRVFFESCEPRILLSADLWGLDLPVNGAADDFTLRLNGDEMELLSGGVVVAHRDLDETSGVVINGEDGYDDSLTIDFGGGVFSLADGITFNGGAGGNDSLTITGGTFATATHTFTGSQSGTIVYDGSTTINYTGLEPVDMTGSALTDLTLTLTAGFDQAVLEDDLTAGNGISQLRSQNGTFETVLFSNTVTNLTINMGDGNDSLTVVSPDYNGALTVNGQTGLDTVLFTDTASFSTLDITVGGTINAGPASNLQTAGNAHFSGSGITLGNGAAIANFGTLTLNATGTAVVFEDSDMVLSGLSTANVFILTSTVGSITDAGGVIRGIGGPSAATLTAATNIGESGAAFHIDLAQLVASSGTVGSGGIFIHDLDDFAANGLKIQDVTADGGLGAIELTVEKGDIADGNPGSNLFGSSVVLSAGRHIGFDGVTIDALEINTGALTATSGTFAAGGDIYLGQGGQSLRLNTISADEGAGTIAILTGAPVDLLDGNGDAVNLQGGNVSLTFGRHIGFDGATATADALETDVTTLAVRAAFAVPVLAGNIYIDELGGSVALGLIEAEAGNISIAAAGDITDANGDALNLSGATVTLAAGGHIGFDGVTEDALETTATTINGIDADGRVALKSAGALTIAGAVSAGANDVKLDAPIVTLAPAALLHVDLAGTAAGQFTRYLITGDVSLGGELEAVLAGGFAPAPLDRFRVMEFGSSGSSFATADLPTDFVLQEHPADIELVYSPDPDIFIQDVDILEGDSGTTDAVFTIFLSHGSVHTVTVDFATADGEATAGSDYQTTSSTLVFAPGETSKMISVPVNGDTVFEAEETFTVELSGAIHGVIEDAAGTAAILNDDPLPAISIDDVTVDEGDGGTTDAQFTVSLSNASAFAIEVSFTTADGTATEGDDYVALTGTVTFDPGETSKQIVIAVKGDVADEPDETFFVQLSLPVNASIANGTGTGTILDDDEPNVAPVFVEIGPQTVVEGHELRFTVEATDPDLPPQELTFSVGPLPAGATFDPTTREFVWLPPDDAMTSVEFTVTDSLDATDVMVVQLTATNAAPTVDAGEDQVVGLQKTDGHEHEHHHKHGHGHHKGAPEADVSIAAMFADLGVQDTHVASIDWGDGTVTEGTVAEPSGGAAGKVTGEHSYTKAGTYTVTVTVTDDDGGTRSDTLLVTVKKPVDKKNFDAREDKYKLKEDTVLQVDVPHGVLANDRTPGDATLEARVIEGPKHGSLVFNADGSFTYVPNADFHGKDSFRYEFTDGNNVSKAAEVKLVVQNVPDKKPHGSCVDWHDRWHAGLGHGDDFEPFGHKGWKRFF